MSINSISPVDGRYGSKTKDLSPFFSEKALIGYRIKVEIAYLQKLSENGIGGLRKFTQEERKILDSLPLIADEDAEVVKSIETKGYKDIPATNHDVKAVEYFIKLKLKDTSMADVLEMVHFALTSEDINNTSMALMIRDAVNSIMIKYIEDVYSALYKIAHENKNLPMLARTHGQPASPTTFGKEILVFVNRLKEEIKVLKDTSIFAKLNGATGNFNAHSVVYPDIDWYNFSELFIESLNNDLKCGASDFMKSVKINIKFNPVTIQIEPHDSYVRIFDSFKRQNMILIDLCQDIWRYISDGWIKQKAVKGEIGSSAMPHKVNPIDFENAEGNFGIANALFSFFGMKLPVSRLQRDLTDSTVQRNIGVAFAHTMVGYQSLLKGLSKISIDNNAILEALLDTPEVIAEAYQNILRAEGVDKPYELLKEVTRGKDVTIDDFIALADRLSVSENVKSKLKSIRPENYVGIAAQIVDKFDPVI